MPRVVELAFGGASSSSSTFCLDAHDTAEGIAVELCDGTTTWRGRLLPHEFTPPKSGAPMEDFRAQVLDALKSGSSSDLAIDKDGDGSIMLLRWSATRTDEELFGLEIRLGQTVQLKSADLHAAGMGLRATLGALASECDGLQTTCVESERALQDLQQQLAELDAVAEATNSSNSADAVRKRRSAFLGDLNRVKRRCKRLSDALESYSKGGDAFGEVHSPGRDDDSDGFDDGESLDGAAAAFPAAGGAGAGGAAAASSSRAEADDEEDYMSIL